MYTARSLTVSPSMLCWSRGGVPGPGGCLVPGWDACLVLRRGLPGPGGWYPSMHWGRPPCEQNSWHTLLKILPCPKLRLRAVKRQSVVGKNGHSVNWCATEWNMKVSVHFCIILKDEDVNADKWRHIVNKISKTYFRRFPVFNNDVVTFDVRMLARWRSYVKWHNW